MSEDRIVYTIPLPGGRDITFSGPFPITPGDWAHMLDVLKAMQPGLTAEPPAGPVKAHCIDAACDVPADERGRHLGDHYDATDGQRWPNAEDKPGGAS